MVYLPPYSPIQHIPHPFSPVSDAKTSNTESGNETYEQKQKRLAEEIKKQQEEALLKLKVDTIKAQNQELIDTIQNRITTGEKELKKFKKTIKKDGSAIQDSGVKGIARWGANFATSMKNAWQSLKGYDKNGKWSGERLFRNIVGVAAGIGICCIPGGAYALAALGVGGAIYGGIESSGKLAKGEREGNQQKIDEAQQDICMNAVIGLTSIFGSGVIGRLFRTSSTTAEVASTAATRANWYTKPVEWISNFGRDITVNSWRAAKYAIKDANKNGWWNATKTNFKNMTAGFSGWEKQFEAKSAEFQQTVMSKLQQVEQKLATETDAGKHALLMEEKTMLKGSLADHASIGSTVKTKADFDKLLKDNKANYSKNHVRTGYSKNAAGKYDINGVLVKEQDFLAFQTRVYKQQKALAKQIENLIKAKANMMRSHANWWNQKKYASEIGEYIPSSDAKRKFYKPSTWLKTKSQIAMDGKNPSYILKTFGTLLTTSALIPAKASVPWFNPVYSTPILLTQELLPETVQQVIEGSQQMIDVLTQIYDDIQKAKTEEELTAAIANYNQLLAMEQAQAQPQAETQPQNPAEEQPQQQLTEEQIAQIKAQQEISNENSTVS